MRHTRHDYDHKWTAGEKLLALAILILAFFALGLLACDGQTNLSVRSYLATNEDTVNMYFDSAPMVGQVDNDNRWVNEFRPTGGEDEYWVVSNRVADVSVDGVTGEVKLSSQVVGLRVVGWTNETRRVCTYTNWSAPAPAVLSSNDVRLDTNTVWVIEPWEPGR